MLLHLLHVLWHYEKRMILDNVATKTQGGKYQFMALGD